MSLAFTMIGQGKGYTSQRTGFVLLVATDEPEASTIHITFAPSQNITKPITQTGTNTQQ